MADWITVQGTASDVGKSVITTYLCEILSKDYDVAPFKPVNYSLNAYPVNNTEIGYSTFFQAKKAETELSKDLNPVLVKPMEEKAEVITDSVEAIEYEKLDGAIGDRYDQIKESMELLDEKYDYVIWEGFSSLINSNLDNSPNTDLLNEVDPEIVLVAELSKGGVEASLKGNVELLPDNLKQNLNYTVINKVHDKAQGADKLKSFVENQTDTETFLLPYVENTGIPPEDGTPEFDGTGEIAVIDYPHSSNTSDLWKLPKRKTSLVEEPNKLENAELIILPGSKNTVSDLKWMKRQGLKDKINEKAGETVVFGVCGGFQMLGEYVEGNSVEEGKEEGLGLIEAATSHSERKRTERVNARFQGEEFAGYRIHYGETNYPKSSTIFETDDGGEGFYQNRVGGTYIHDALSQPVFLEWLLEESGIQDANIKASNREKLKEAIHPLASHLAE